jgi:hypothetical protein
MLEDEVLTTVSGESIGIRESGTDHIQLVAIDIGDENIRLEAFLIPQEAMVLAEKLIRFANAAIAQQPVLKLRKPLQNG